MGWPSPYTYGLRRDHLTAELLTDFARLYDACTGANVCEFWRAEDRWRGVMEDLEERRDCERRFGYPGNDHAKLILRDLGSGLIKVFLDTNDDYDGYPEASVPLMDAFRERVEKLLQDRGIAVLLPSPVRPTLFAWAFFFSLLLTPFEQAEVDGVEVLAVTVDVGVGLGFGDIMAQVPFGWRIIEREVQAIGGG
jgi:hypothetical protein